jgi:hypothetical protein
MHVSLLVSNTQQKHGCFYQGNQCSNKSNQWTQKRQFKTFIWNSLTRIPYPKYDSMCLLVLCYSNDYPKHFKLVEIFLMMVLGIVEDKWCFSTLSFIKFKFIETSRQIVLILVIKMFD